MLSHSPRLTYLAAAVGLVTFAACNGGETTRAADPVPTNLQIVSGDAQHGVVGHELAAPVTVRITDAGGKPVRGQVVNFRVVTGGGSVYAGTALTDADGTASDRWTLGTIADTQRVEARAVTADGTKQLFGTAWALAAAGAPAAATIAGGDGQQGRAGDTVADSLAVRVTDQYGNAVSGVAVAWAGENGAAPSATSVTTGTVGRAAVRLTLGSTVGPQGATATVTSLPALHFTATASAANPASVEHDAGDAQSAPEHRALANPIVVRVTDRFGNPVAGVAVAWSVAAGGGTVDPASSVTAADGRALTHWTLGAAGENRLTATVGSLTPVNFTATATTLRLVAYLTQVSGTVGEQVTSDRFMVRVVDASDQPVAGIPVRWQRTDGSAQLVAFTGARLDTTTVQTNSSGYAGVGVYFGLTAGQSHVDISLPGSPSAAHVVGTITTNAGPWCAMNVYFEGSSNVSASISAPAGSVVPLHERAVDMYGNPAPSSANASLSVASGGGTLAQPRAGTVPGERIYDWTLGPNAGTQTVTYRGWSCSMIGSQPTPRTNNFLTTMTVQATAP